MSRDELALLAGGVGLLYLSGKLKVGGQSVAQDVGAGFGSVIVDTAGAAAQVGWGVATSPYTAGQQYGADLRTSLDTSIATASQQGDTLGWFTNTINRAIIDPSQWANLLNPLNTNNPIFLLQEQLAGVNHAA